MADRGAFDVFLSWLLRTLDDRIEELSRSLDNHALSLCVESDRLKLACSLIGIDSRARQLVHNSVAWEMMRLRNYNVRYRCRIAGGGGGLTRDPWSRICYTKATRKAIRVNIHVHMDASGENENLNAALTFRGVDGACTITYVKGDKNHHRDQPDNPHLSFLTELDEWITPSCGTTDAHWYVRLGREPRRKRKRGE